MRLVSATLPKFVPVVLSARIAYKQALHVDVGAAVLRRVGSEDQVRQLGTIVSAAVKMRDEIY